MASSSAAQSDRIGVEDARAILGCSRQTVHNYVEALEGEYREVRGKKTLLVSRAACERLQADLGRAKYARTRETSRDTEESANLKRESRFSLEMAELDEKLSRDANTRAIEEHTRVLHEISSKLDRLERIEKLLRRERAPQGGGGLPWEMKALLATAAVAAAPTVLERFGVKFDAAPLVSEPQEALSEEDRAAFDRAVACAERGENPTDEDYRVWARATGIKL